MALPRGSGRRVLLLQKELRARAGLLWRRWIPVELAGSVDQISDRQGIAPCREHGDLVHSWGPRCLAGSARTCRTGGSWSPWAYLARTRVPSRALGLARSGSTLGHGTLTSQGTARPRRTGGSVVSGSLWSGYVGSWARGRAAARAHLQRALVGFNDGETARLAGLAGAGSPLVFFEF